MALCLKGFLELTNANQLCDGNGFATLMRGKSSRKAEEFFRITALPTQWLCHSDARQVFS
jgi:hypothetical protein